MKFLMIFSEKDSWKKMKKNFPDIGDFLPLFQPNQKLPQSLFNIYERFSGK